MGVSCSKCVKQRQSQRNGDNESQANPSATRYDIGSSARRQPQNNTEKTFRLELGGNELLFDINVTGDGSCPNMTVKLRTRERKDSVKKTVESQRPSRDRVFTCEYTAASLATKLQRTRLPFPAGSFIDCRNIPLRNSMSEVHELGRWSHSVCQIRFGNGTATGFRVGSRFIMTASHVVKKIIRTLLPQPEQRDVQSQIAVLANPNMFCLFDYFKENQFGNVRKFYFKADIHFCNEETDTAVLELDDNSDGVPMPEPFRDFGFPEGKFTFIGHMGSAMECNMVDLIIDKDHERTREDIRCVTDYNNGKTNESYEFPPHNTLTNEHRVLFHCKFGKGASGSPGIIVQGNGSVAVVTMLLCGYPNWYYAEHVDRDLLLQWPREYCIEQGADLIAVENIMERENPNLHEEIFCRYNLPSPGL